MPADVMSKRTQSAEKKRLSFDYITGHAHVLPADAEACKASEHGVAIKTQCGERIMIAPATMKQMRESPESQEWIEADDIALQAIRHITGHAHVGR